MADLKTDYKDDVLDTSQNTKRKYEVIENPDGTISLVDVTEYLQEGDNFGADDINAITHAVNNIATDAEHTSYDNTESGLQATNVQDAVDEINDNLSEINGAITDINKYILVAKPVLDQNVLLKLWSYTADSNQQVNIQSVIQLASNGNSLSFSVKVNGTEVFEFAHGSSSPFQLPAGEYYDRVVVNAKTGDLIEIYTRSSYSGSIYSRTSLLSNVQFTAHVS